MKLFNYKKYNLKTIHVKNNIVKQVIKSETKVILKYFSKNCKFISFM